MLQHYFKTAWRNLTKNTVSSVINVGGLAAGITVVLLISFWINDELTYNKSFKGYDKIARVMQKQTANGTTYSGMAMPYPMGKELQANYAQNFRHVVMASWERDGILGVGDKRIAQPGIYMDVDAPSLLSLNMLKGSLKALSDPHSIILSASAARAMFGDEDPMNRLMKIDNKLDVKVTGVYEDIAFNTDFRNVKYISTWELYTLSENWVKDARDSMQWDNNSFQVFAQIADKTNFETVNRNIEKSKFVKVAANDKKYNARVFLHPMKDWHLRSKWDDNGNNIGGAIQYVWLFAMVGLFVLVLATINFMNLSTARSEKRAKEVGVRKAIGSLRKNLVLQFYCESLLVVLIAFVSSIVFAALLLPWFNSISGKQIVSPLNQPGFWLISAGFIIFTSLLAASYPAFYLSSFRPVKVLKGTFKAGSLAAIPRKTLVVLQFTISSVLIISTLIVYSQIQHSKNRPIGYDRNGVMMIAMKTPDFYGKHDMIESELKSRGVISAMSESSSPVTGIWSSNNGFSWQDKDPELDAEFATVWVTHDFGKTVGWQFLGGRDFSRDFRTDSVAIVVNEAAVKFMNMQNPVGAFVERNGTKFQIIGVIKDMIQGSPFEKAEKTVYFMDYNNVNWMNLKLAPEKSLGQSVSTIESVFKKLIPNAPFEFRFADTEYAAKFAAEERIGTLSTFFTALAVLISCLGLFGLSSFIAEQRTKEIGIRKVLGASVFNLWNLLSREFLLLVFLSIVISVPIAYYFMQEWLLNYNYRTEIYWWIFAIAGGAAMLLTLVTVSFQTIRAALTNPVKSIKAE